MIRRMTSRNPVREQLRTMSMIKQGQLVSEQANNFDTASC